MDCKVAVLAGDGIGPEVMKVTLDVLKACTKDHQFIFTEALVGGAAIDEKGQALPAETLQLCEESHAVLFGSVGGPKWENLPPDQQPERGALLPLRKHFSLFANLRPAIIFPQLKEYSPLSQRVLPDKLDILILRELTGGIYFGQPKGKETADGEESAYDTMRYSKSEIVRIAKLAFDAARLRGKRVHSIDKANVLTTMVFWREVVEEVHKDYPDVELTHQYVDNTAMQLIKDPGQFDVILCSNMFGDILSDEASQITGSIGMLPSASLGEEDSKYSRDGFRFGLYEPAGGSAPDIAGQGIANPVAQILSAAMMLRYSFKLEKEASSIEKAVDAAIESGYRTGDIAGDGTKPCSTAEMGKAILDRLS